MRIVTRPDFDGIVCAVLLLAAENINDDIHWVEPGEIQSGKAVIRPGDILANLPYSRECELWFDHHISNKPEGSFKGAFDIAPSAARVVYAYYQQKGKINTQFDELILHTDIIDAAKLNKHQVQFPERYPYILLSMTIKNNDYKDIDYWNHLVHLLRNTQIDRILEDPQVKIRCRQVVKENTEYEAYLRQYTKIRHNISITDFRPLEKVPDGNRFLSYCLFPECIASIKIRFSGTRKQSVQVSIGQSIFNRQCHVNIGRLLSQFGGGGHEGAGGCTLNLKTADADIEKILEILFTNAKEI